MPGATPAKENMGQAPADWHVTCHADIQNHINDPRHFQQIRQSIQDVQKSRATPYIGAMGTPDMHLTAGSGGSHMPVGGYGQNNHFTAYAHQHGVSPPLPYNSNASALQFKPNLFYKIETPIGEVRTLDEMAGHRNTVEFTIRTRDTPQLAQCATNPNLRIMVLCASGTGGVQDIAFPQNSELKIHGDEIKANMRGLKNKPGSTRPVDITRYLRLNPPTYPNRVHFTYALTQSKFYITICICRITPIEELVKGIEASGRKIPKDSTVADLKKKAADPDVVATSQKLSLKCPLSYMRLGLPCRSIHCKHLQCFDCTSYLQLQEQGPQWKCPVCNSPARYESLAVDMYVKEILDKVSEDLEQVTIEPDGLWHTETSSPSGRPKHGQIDTSTASFYPDDDDDVIAIPDDRNVTTPTTPFTLARSLGTPSLVPSRESSSIPRPSSCTASTTKRHVSELIDLTFDSDDDDPPRPVKKPNYGPIGPFTGGHPANTKPYY